jgi:hypothetical protein
MRACNILTSLVCVVFYTGKAGDDFGIALTPAPERPMDALDELLDVFSPFASKDE